MRRNERPGADGAGYAPRSLLAVFASAADQAKARLAGKAGPRFEPREKQTTDEPWIQEHGSSVVDIANTSYADLPRD